MIKAIRNLKIGVNTKMLISLYKSLIQSVLPFAAPVLLLACNTALQNLERTQRVPLRYILGLLNETNSIMIYRESGILPHRLLIKKETATYLLRAPTKPIQTDTIQRIQEETQEDLRVFNDASWSIKAAWLQKEFGIPPVIPPMSNERAPWLEPPIQIIIQNPIQKKVDPEGAAIEATNRIAYLNDSRTPTINIYTEASSQDNGTTAWACFIKEKDEEIRGRIPNHTPITLAELHAVKAALRWISRQTIHEIITEIYTTTAVSVPGSPRAFFGDSAFFFSRKNRNHLHLVMVLLAQIDMAVCHSWCNFNKIFLAIIRYRFLYGLYRLPVKLLDSTEVD